MKNLIKKGLLCALLIAGSTNGFAQNSEQAAEKLHETKELKIAKFTTYLEEHADYILTPQELADFERLLEGGDEHEGHESSFTNIEQMKEKFVRAVLYKKFLAENPNFTDETPMDHHNLSFPDPCFRGDFESGSFVTFEGYHHIGTSALQCAQIPADVTIDPGYVSLPMTGLQPEFLLTNNVPDPIVPASALYQTSGGSLHALRVNLPGGGGNISVLRKNFSTPSSGLQIVSFNAAIVLEAPHNNTYDPFVTARIIDATSGTVVGGPICITPTSPGVVWTPFVLSGAPYVWMDWDCFNISYNGVMGSNYVLEISVGDCGYTPHGGYAYIDDICNVLCAPMNTDCCDAAAGQVLSWSEVPGAVSYEVAIFYNDPACCSTTSGAPLGMSVIVTDNMIMPSTTYSTCYSWRVRAIFADGSKTGFSDKLCDCGVEPVNPCATPTNLGCQINAVGRYLTWDAVPGALGGYIIQITYNDNDCPGCSGTETVVNMSTTDNWLMVVGSGCFSWRVRSVCSTTSLSEWSETKCACTSPGIEGKSTIDQMMKEMEVLIVPNPADEFVSITLKSDKFATTSPSKLVIVTAAGEEMIQSSIQFNSAKQIDVSNLSAGIYFYSVIHDDVQIASGKLIIE